MDISNRTRQRINVMMMLYNEEITSDSSNLNLDLDEFGKKLYFEIKNNLERIDKIISDNLKDYKINRLNIVDKQIIRIAVLELLNKTDKRIVINEAINLSKVYTECENFDSSKFNNKLLDTISISLGEVNE